MECRNALGLSPSKFYILFNHSFGNNLLRKNKPLADAAMDIVKQHFKDAELLIAGQVSQLQMPIFINASDAVLQTSLHEGSPNIIKEAMACDVPVISVPCGDVHERIIDDSIGFICNYDAQALAVKIIEVLQNGSRSKGRESIFNQQLSSEQVATRISKIYTDLLT